MDFLADATDFVGQEISSDKTSQELRKWSAVFPWIDEDNAATYFELALETPAYMHNIALVYNIIIFSPLPATRLYAPYSSAGYSIIMPPLLPPLDGH